MGNINIAILVYMQVKYFIKSKVQSSSFRRPLTKKQTQITGKVTRKGLINAWYNKLFLMDLEDETAFMEKWEKVSITLEQWENIWRKAKASSVCVATKDEADFIMYGYHFWNLNKIRAQIP